MITSNTKLLFSKTEQYILVLFGVISFVFGLIGFHQYFSNINENATNSDLAYLSVNLFFVQFSAKGELPILLDIARWLAPITLSYTLISAVLVLMQNHLKKVRLKYLKNHAVVIGIDEHSVKLALSFKEKGLTTIAVDHDEQNEFWGELQKSGVLIYNCNPSDKSLLAAVNISHASYLFAATQSDATNIEIIYDTHRIKQENANQTALESVCQIYNRSLRDTLYNRPLFATNHTNHTTRLVDYNAIAARWIVNQFGPHTLIPDFSKRSSLKIFMQGDDKVLIELIQRIAALGIYSNPASLQIILLGERAQLNYQELMAQTPTITELVTIDPCLLSCFNSQSYSELLNKYQPDIIYICGQGTDEKLMTIQTLEDSAFKGEVVVCEIKSKNTLGWLAQEFSANQKIKFAEINSVVCHFDNIFDNRLDRLAMAIHQDYVKQQLANGDSPDRNSSLISWDLLPEILKDANRNQADHIFVKTKYLIGSDTPNSDKIKQALSQTNTLILAEMEHRRWLAEKKLAGWRYTKGEKNARTKRSPSLIEWHELSNSEKQKDIDTIEQLPKLVDLIIKQ